jgi:hypothetical protein
VRKLKHLQKAGVIDHNQVLGKAKTKPNTRGTLLDMSCNFMVATGLREVGDNSNGESKTPDGDKVARHVGEN